jgi:hypothetical protein
MFRQRGSLPYPVVAEHINMQWQYSLENNYVGSNPSINIFFFPSWICFKLTNTKLNCTVTYLLFNDMFQKVTCAPLVRLEMRVMQIFLLFDRNYYLFTDILI